MVKDSECCRAEKLKFAIYSRFREPKLYKYAARGDWDLVPHRCRTHPNEAKFVHKFPPGDTALHRILRGVEVDSATKHRIDELRLRAVSALLESNREAATLADSFGRTPLHLACMDIRICGEGVAYILMKAGHQGIQMQDIEGRTPLHYLVGRNQRIPLALVAEMVSVSPTVLEIRDVVKETVLDVALDRRDDIEDSDSVIQFFKTGTICNESRFR
mmetsp:Transcript_5417/g.9418  ORF Transcript_5417/g.9418 Transcript_5417/m.9418 type:complete len:216 (-) Transcript_5417:566-1213(-)